MMSDAAKNTLNTASLELQGRIASLQGNPDAAFRLLEKAHKNELELGYGEPPLYARPVAASLAEARILAGKYDEAIKTYEDLLKRFPKSLFVYSGFLRLYKMKGDTAKVKEYEVLRAKAAQYADAGIYR